MTIRNFGDHSANERTFLAWVRTSVAVMAFGFLVEKFDLFLSITRAAVAGRTAHLGAQKYGNIAGLSLIIVGIAMIVIAAVRFFKTARDIDDAEMKAGPGYRTDLALAFLLVLLGTTLFLYLSNALVSAL